HRVAPSLAGASPPCLEDGGREDQRPGDTAASEPEQDGVQLPHHVTAEEQQRSCRGQRRVGTAEASRGPSRIHEAWASRWHHLSFGNRPITLPMWHAKRPLGKGWSTPA